MIVLNIIKLILIFHGTKTHYKHKTDKSSLLFIDK